MRFVSSVLLFWICSIECLSQEQPSKHAISLELLGLAGYGSVNYEHFFNQKEKRFIALRIGLGIAPVFDAGSVEERLGLGLPHGVTVNFGRKNYFETGLYGNLHLIPQEVEGAYTTYLLGPMIGYRRQTPKWFFRIFLATCADTGPYHLVTTGGLAFGFPFLRRGH